MTDEQKKKATCALCAFTSEELGWDIEPSFVNERAVPFFYTQTLDGEHDMQFYADFENATIYFTIDGSPTHVTKYDGFDDLCYNLSIMSAAALVGDADDYCYQHGICEIR